MMGKTKDQMYLNRKRAAEVGQETVQILREGCYINPQGKRIEIGEQVQAAVSGTIGYPPGEGFPVTSLLMR